MSVALVKTERSSLPPKIGKLAPATVDKFCQWYLLLGENATQAYLKIRPRLQANSAATEGWRLLRNPDVKQRIRELRVELHDQLFVRREEVLQEIQSMAMFDPGSMFDEAGNLLPLSEMDPPTRKMVNEIKMEVLESDENGRQEILRMATVKYGRDKLSALEKLMRYFNAYEDNARSGRGEIKAYFVHPLDAEL